MGKQVTVKVGILGFSNVQKDTLASIMAALAGKELEEFVFCGEDVVHETAVKIADELDCNHSKYTDTLSDWHKTLKAIVDDCRVIACVADNSKQAEFVKGLVDAAGEGRAYIEITD